MLVNKWVLVALGLVVTVLGYLSTVDWQTLMPSKAGAIISVIGVLKVVLAALMPPPTQTVVQKLPGTTATSIVTHT